MQDLIIRFASICLLSILALTGCTSKGSQFLGTWVNAHDPADTFQVERNGDEYLIVIKDKKVGATYKDGSLQIGGTLLSVDLTYVKQTDTVLGQGFWGPIEYRRKR